MFIESKKKNKKKLTRTFLYTRGFKIWLKSFFSKISKTMLR